MKTIENTHPRYDEYIELWVKARDFYEGEDQVKSKGETYLPRSNDDPQMEETIKYNKYKSRAFFYEATARTVEGLVGLATHKPPTIEIPVSMGHPDKYTKGDASIDTFIQDVIRENIITARQGLLIDRKDDGAAYIVQYIAEQIINWHYEGETLVFAVLEETYNDYNPADPYNTKEETQYRELRMEDGAYVQNIWRKVNGKYAITETITPTNRGVTLDHIPFVFTSRAKLGNTVDKSPIMGMVNSNCHHYQLNADYAHALHYVAMPTLALYGVNSDGDDVEVGSDAYLAFESPDAKAEYVEISGNGIPSMANALNRMEDHMAHLGSRLLQSRKAGIESAEAIRLSQTAETSSLYTNVIVAEQALQAAFDEITAWENIGQNVNVDLNKDFVNVNLQPNEVDALTKAYLAKTMSLDTLIYNLQRGELLPEGRSIEQEMELIGGVEDDTQTEGSPVEEIQSNN